LTVTSSTDPSEGAARFDFQLRMLEKGASEVVAQMGRLDDLLFKIRASFITVWVATIGWAFTVKNTRLVPLAFINRARRPGCYTAAEFI
jgi:hypothetical protein